MVYWLKFWIYILYTTIYIIILLMNFDHDFRVIMRNDEMRFNTLHTTWILTILYLFFLYFISEYKKISLLQICILLIISSLLFDTKEDVWFYNNQTSYYYYYSYIILFWIHFTAFWISIYWFIKGMKNNSKLN